MKKAIAEMKANSILWNTNHPDYRSSARYKAIEESSKKIGITSDRMANLIKYIKKQLFLEKRKMKKKAQNTNPNEMDNSRVWKWYKHCWFINNWKGYQAKYLDPPKPSIDSFESHPDDPEQSEPDLEENISTGDQSSEVPDPESSNLLDSATKVYVVDPDTGSFSESENESNESFQHQSDNAEDSIEMHSNHDIDIFSEEKPPEVADSKNFLINGVCSSLELHLSNDKYTEDDVVEFHSKIILFMHSYFKKKM
ncbi:uncharacterized protein LOC129802108 isoform X2 [Phlebotomus papatasi]|nr:uncharacterized protein LOC129802108 isoform X2 [Phlebotomus papatasi]